PAGPSASSTMHAAGMRAPRRTIAATVTRADCRIRCNVRGWGAAHKVCVWSARGKRLDRAETYVTLAVTYDEQSFRGGGARTHSPRNRGRTARDVRLHRRQREYQPRRH